MQKGNIMAQKNRKKQSSWQQLRQNLRLSMNVRFTLLDYFMHIKIHKVGNPVRVITSGCGTAIENLSIFVEKCLYSEVFLLKFG